MKNRMKKVIPAVLALTIFCANSFDFTQYRESFSRGELPAVLFDQAAKKIKKTPKKHYLANPKELEDAIVKQIRSHNPKIVIPINYHKLGDEGLDDALNRVMARPEALSMLEDWSFDFSGGKKGKYDFIIKMKYPKGALETNTFIKKWVKENIHSGMSDFEKVKTIHDYMILNYEYRSADEKEKNNGYNVYFPSALVMNKGGVCRSYALLFYEFAKQAGMNVRYVSGDMLNEDVKHAWNYIEVDNRWYAIDVTHDEYYPDQKGVVRYDYFLRSDDFMAKTRKWDRNKYPKAPKDYEELFPFALYAGNADIEDEQYETIDSDNTEFEITQSETKLQPKSNDPQDYGYLIGKDKVELVSVGEDEFLSNDWGAGAFIAQIEGEWNDEVSRSVADGVSDVYHRGIVDFDSE